MRRSRDSAQRGAGIRRSVEQGPRLRGCAPDPVRAAPVREGARKAAINIREAGRIASAPASGPSANGSQPHPFVGCSVLLFIIAEHYGQYCVSVLDNY